MKRLSRYQQTTLILGTILLVLLALWYLLSHPKRFGAIGAWASTNIFGPATLSLTSGPHSGDIERTATEGPDMQPMSENELESSNSNAANHSAQISPSNLPPAALARSFPTNLLRTNGPVTTIAIDPLDLVETPPGVTAASNTSEANTIAQRLGEASAKGGDIQISLSWNNYNDLDLHCIDPTGEEIWFSHPIARSNGELDVDRNAHPPYTPAPVENIYWPTGGAPSGLYRIFVVYYSPRNGLDPSAPTAFTVRTVVRGWKTYYFKSTITFTGRQEAKLICTLQYDPTNRDPERRFRFVQ